NVYAMATAPDGSVWAGTGSGLSHLVDGRWQNFPGPRGKRFISVVSDSKGTFWAAGAEAFEGTTVWRVDGAEFHPLSAASGSLINDAISLAIDRDDSLWIGTDTGAVR